MTFDADLHDQRFEQAGRRSHRRGVEGADRHQRRKQRFVMMSFELYQMLKAADPRRVYGAGEAPDEINDLFADAIERLAEGDFA
jgi:hypothetical protein